MLPKMRTKSADGQGAASRTIVHQRGSGTSPGRDPSLEAVATSCAGCEVSAAAGGRTPGVRVWSVRLRGRAAPGSRVF